MMIQDLALTKLKLKQLQKEVLFIQDTHEYYANLNQPLTPVSRVIQQVTPQFDQSGDILKRCAAKEGVTEAELKERWEQKKVSSMEYGTKFHSEAEMVLWGCEQHLENKSSNLSQANLVMIKYLSNIIDTETIIFDTELGIAGTIDILTYDPKEGIIIWDWKTNEKIDEEGYGYLLPPVDALKNSTFNKYALQMGVYRYLLERKGFKVAAQRLIHIPNEKQEHQIIELPYLRDYVLKMIESKGINSSINQNMPEKEYDEQNKFNGQ